MLNIWLKAQYQRNFVRIGVTERDQRRRMFLAFTCTVNEVSNRFESSYEKLCGCDQSNGTSLESWSLEHLSYFDFGHFWKWKLIFM